MKFSTYLDSLRGKRVTVIGAGISNMPLIEVLLDAGIDTTICDQRHAEDLEPRLRDYGDADYLFGQHGARLRLGYDYLSDLDADVIFRTPGLMPWHPSLIEAVLRGAVLTSEMEVFFDVCPCKIIAVTGSDGKTTTSSIIAKLLEHEGIKVHLGGNIGTPLLCRADEINPDDVAVLELSSFQLITMNKSPDIAVITNVTPNHLDVHSSMDEYVEAKLNIIAHGTGSSRAVFNMDDEISRGFAGDAPGEALFFSRQGRVPNGVFVENETIYESSSSRIEAIMPVGDISLPGMHNVENYMAAFAAVRGLASRETMAHVAKTFNGVAHRIEFVRELSGVKYYNDSIASSPSRTIAGLKAFDQKVILIAGGKGKNLPFDGLATEIVRHVKTLVLTGMTANDIRDAVIVARGDSRVPGIVMCEDFKEAVLAASAAAHDGDVVLLSPACTSFDRFTNFEERGNLFKEIVEGMTITMEIEEILTELCTLPGPSGLEGAVAERAKTMLARYMDETWTDIMGNVIGVRRCGKPNARKLMIDAHIDEIGLVVTGIEEGFLRFASIGGSDARLLPASGVEILTDPPRYGVIGALPPHVLKKEDTEKVTEIEHLYIDVGLTQEDAAAIPLGTPCVLSGGVRRLNDTCLCGKAFDDRAGFSAILYAVELLAETELDVDLYVMASVQEEVGIRGAAPGAFAIAPDWCIVVDVDYAKTPDTQPFEVITELGGGVIISRGPNMNSAMTKLADKLAIEKGIKHQVGVEPGGSSGTNASAIQVSREGVATALFGIPLRYMHSPREVVSLEDIENTALLLKEMAIAVCGQQVAGRNVS